jgi:DNA-binding CsgD family transcriptional regulator
MFGKNTTTPPTPAMIPSVIIERKYGIVSALQIDFMKPESQLKNSSIQIITGSAQVNVNQNVMYIARKKIGNPKLAGFIAAIVCSNIVMWLFEKLVSWEYEFLSVMYIASEFLLLIVYWMMQDYVHKSDIQTYTKSEKERLAVQITTMTMEEKLTKVLTFVKEDNPLSMREREILEMVIAGKRRKEIADTMHLSENTVKTYTRTLYGKLNISCREELYELLLQNN